MLKSGFSYFGVRRLDHVRTDMLKMREEGSSQVLHTWSEEDLSYYRDTMGEIIRASHETGLSVYVNSWAVGRVFGGEANSELVAKNPGSCQILSTGEPVPAICPNHPAFETYMDSWIDAVADAGADTFFWDEPHFFFRKGRDTEWACHCNVCRALFHDEFGGDMPSQATPEVTIFRQNSLLRLLGRWTERVASRGKRNNICLLPDIFDAGLPDWESVAALPHLDELSSDPYWFDEDPEEKVRGDYGLYAKRLVELCAAKGIEPQMWMKLYRIKRGTEHFAPLAAKISYDAGIRNLMAWSWRASEWMSWLRSDDPEAAHQAMVDGFRKLSTRP